MSRVKSRFFLAFIVVFISQLAYSQKPNIREVSVNKGPVGIVVTINGDNFSSPLQVFFGGTEGRIESSSDNLIEVKVPGGALYDEVEVKNLGAKLSAKSLLPFLLSYGGENLSPGLFNGQLDFSSENGLYDLCLCDFNLDGKLDVATANNNSNFINVLRNTNSAIGTVSFISSFVPVNSPTLNIKCADINLDGKPDVLLSKSGSITNKIILLENTSTGPNITFNTPVQLTISGNIARRIDVADLDLDGRPEIVVTNQSNNEINIFTREATTNGNIIATPITVSVLGLSSNAGLLVEDLDGDQKAEVVVNGFLAANLYVLKNTSTPGNISFAAATMLPVSGSLTNVTAADLDSDDDLDLVTASFTTSKVSVLKNNGGLSFGAPQTFDVAQSPWGIDVADMNGDMRPDLVVSSVGAVTKEISILENWTNGGAITFNRVDLPVNELTRNVKLGDIDRDGKPDIALASIDNSNVSIIRNANCFVPKIVQQDVITRCSDSPVILRSTAAPGATYKWYRETGGAEVLVKDSNEPFVEDLPGEGNFNYRVEALTETNNCVKTSGSVNVDVVSGTVPKDPAITQTGPYCEGGPIVLDGSLGTALAGVTYNWTLPDGSTVSDTDPTLTIDPATLDDAGIYSLIISKGICESEEVSELVQVVSTSVDISQSGDAEICADETTTLSVPSQVGNSYQWLLDGGDISGATSNSYDPVETGDYSVRITTPESCNITPTAISITVIDLPVVDFTAPATACAGQFVDFIDETTLSSGQTGTYSWDFGDGGTSDEQNPTYSFDGTGNFNVSLTVSYNGNCGASFQKMINITASPAFDISASGDINFCEGGSVDLTATNGFTNYLWNSGASGATITATETGTYIVTADAGGGCEVNATVDVEVFPNPTIVISASKTEVKEGTEVELTASGASTYEWTPPETLSTTIGATTTATPVETTTYTVTGTSDDNCTGMEDITISVVTVIGQLEVDPMKSFSPNGDTVDDLWVIDGIENYENCTVSIFTRNGRKVFEEKSYTNDWDAVENGRLLPEGVYFFVITCENTSSTYKGSVLIAR